MAGWQTTEKSAISVKKLPLEATFLLGVYYEKL